MNNSSVMKVLIDGEELFISGLWQSGTRKDSALIEISEVQVLNALKPIVKISKMVGEKMKELSPDETEMTINLSLGLDGNRIVFGLADVSAEAGISLKFLWKKSDQE